MSESVSRLELQIDSTGAERNAKSLGRELNTLDKSGGALSATVAKLSGVLASAFALDKTIRTVTAFQDSMLRLQATSNATTQAMGQLEKQSRALGATSRFSAQQAADAQNFLAMAGFKVNEILSATPSVMKFASAASLDLARSADIASNVLGGMQLPVSELEKVMNTMINTAQSANTNVSQLGEAFAYAAPLAVTAGISIDTLSASVGVLGDAGIQGGRAGTALVGVIRQLSDITPKAEASLAKYGISIADMDIKTHGLTAVLKRLGEANLETGDAIRIFGSEAAAAGLILSKNVERVGELTDANEKAAGKLNEVANILDSGLSAAFASVNSAIEEMMLRTGDGGLTSTMKVLAVTTAGVISNFNGMGEEFAEASGLSKEFARNIEILSGALKLAGAVIGGYVIALGLAKAGAIAGAVANGIYAASLAAITGQAATTSASLLSMKTAYGVVGAAFTGWSIGTYLRNEFEVVEKSGIALMSGLHQAAVYVMGQFDIFSENMKFALTNPLDFARGKIAEFLQWVAGLGTGLAGALGFDVAGLESQIASGLTAVRGTVAAEHAKTIADMRTKNKAAMSEVADGYFEQFEQVGKSVKLLDSNANAAAKSVAGVTKTTNAASKATDSLTKSLSSESKELGNLITQYNKSDAALEKYNKGIARADKALKAGEISLKQYQNIVQGLYTDLNKPMWDKFNKDAEEATRRTKALKDQFMSIADRLDPLSATTRAYAKEVAYLTDNQAALEAQGLNVTDMLTGLEAEYQKNISATSEWAQMTERAMDSVDSAFVDMWRNIGSGFESFADSLKNAFKNLLAEMAHMAITRPILMQFGSMLGIGGGGSSSAGGIIGAMSGGGGGGFSLTSMLGAAKNIYSAFTGGLAGMVSTVGGYASTIGATIGSSALSSFGAGMQGAYLAPGLAGPTTAGAGGAMGVGSTAGSSMAAAWPLAVIAGMIQSGKLYDQGVRPDASEMAKVGGDTLLGKGMAWTQGGQSAFFKGLDSILEPVVGGKIAAMLTGSTFHQALWGSIGSKLFGGAWKTKEAGLALDVNDGDLRGWDYTYKKKKGGLFSSNKKKTSYSEMDAERLGLFTDAFDATKESVSGLYKELGFDVSDSVLNGLNIGIQRINTMGLSEEKAQEAVEKWFTNAAETINSQLDKTFGAELGLDVAGLQGLIGNMLAVNAVFETIGLTAFSADVAGAKLAESLAVVAGGLESFAAISDSYYASFVDDQTKLEQSLKEMRRPFADLEVATPRTREQFKALVESLDLTTDAGQKTLVGLLSLSGGMSEYYAALENLERSFYASFTPLVEQNRAHLAGLNDEFKTLGQQMPISRNDFIDLVNSFDLTTDAGEDMRRALLQLAPAMSDYYNVLEQFAFNITGVSNSLSQNIGGFREQIFLDQFDDKGKFDYAKAQADALSAMLPDLTDLGLIEQTTNDIIRLTQTAYGLLDEQGKQQQGAEFIQMLDELEALSRDRAAQAQLEQTEQQAKIMSDAMTTAAERMAASMEEAMKSGAADQSAVAAMFDSIGQAIMNQFAALSVSRFGEVT